MLEPRRAGAGFENAIKCTGTIVPVCEIFYWSCKEESRSFSESVFGRYWYSTKELEVLFPTEHHGAIGHDALPTVLEHHGAIGHDAVGPFLFGV